MADELETKNDMVQSIYVMIAATAGVSILAGLVSFGAGWVAGAAATAANIARAERVLVAARAFLIASRARMAKIKANQLAAFVLRFAGFATQATIATAAVKQVALDQDPLDLDNWSRLDLLGVGAGGLTSAGLFMRSSTLARTPARALASGLAADAATSAAVDVAGGNATPGQVFANALLSAGTGRIPLNRTHVFRGEINAKGKAVGFHHQGPTPDGTSARIVPGTQTTPDGRGVYQAKIEIYDPATGTWIRKNRESSFFPDSWSQERVVYEIQAASRNRVLSPPGKPANHWQGFSPSGMEIGGYLGPDGSILTAYPIP